MSVKKIIENRRSVFPVQYNSEPVAVEQLQELLNAANWAPTHKKTEPWRFKVLREKKVEFAEFLLKGLTERSESPVSEFKQDKIRKKFEQSSAVFAICMQRDEAERIPEWEEISSTAMAVQNMWLRATEMGIGSYWSSPKKLIPIAEQFFGLPEREHCLGFFFIGNFDGELNAGERTSMARKTEWL